MAAPKHKVPMIEAYTVVMSIRDFGGSLLSSSLMDLVQPLNVVLGAFLCCGGDCVCKPMAVLEVEGARQVATKLHSVGGHTGGGVVGDIIPIVFKVSSFLLVSRNPVGA